jgi:hypothetical protein
MSELGQTEKDRHRPSISAEASIAEVFAERRHSRSVPRGDINDTSGASPRVLCVLRSDSGYRWQGPAGGGLRTSIRLPGVRPGLDPARALITASIRSGIHRAIASMTRQSNSATNSALAAATERLDPWCGRSSSRCLAIRAKYGPTLVAHVWPPWSRRCRTAAAQGHAWIFTKNRPVLSAKPAEVGKTVPQRHSCDIASALDRRRSSRKSCNRTRLKNAVGSLAPVRNSACSERRLMPR